MPRYFFDLTDQGKHWRDEFGAELADHGEARDQAVALLSDIAHEALPEEDQHAFSAEVRDERDRVIYEASLILSGRWWPDRPR